MSFYQNKLLKLEGIKEENNQHYLNIVFSLDQDVETLWEIDPHTAENLKAITQFNAPYQYRLSFNASWNKIDKQYVSTITRTYLNHSEQIYFACSKDYADQLLRIKNVQCIENFEALNLSNLKHTSAEVHCEENPVPHKETSFQFYRLKKAASIAFMSAIFVILFSALNSIYSNEYVFNEVVLAQSIALDANALHAEEKAMVPVPNDLDENIHLAPYTTPFIELDQSINYGIPKGYVALTFDDGPSKYSAEIMEILKKYNVGGTFFFTGTNAKKYPESIQYIQSNGYSIGSHSMSHRKMSALSIDEQKFEIIESINILNEITNTEITLFRPPYGSFNKGTKNILESNEFPMVLWSIDPRDWETRDSDKIFDYIRNSEVSGSIILLHESQSVIDALPSIIEYLHELGLQIVSLK